MRLLKVAQYYAQPIVYSPSQVGAFPAPYSGLNVMPGQETKEEKPRAMPESVPFLSPATTAAFNIPILVGVPAWFTKSVTEKQLYRIAEAAGIAEPKRWFRWPAKQMLKPHLKEFKGTFPFTMLSKGEAQYRTKKLFDWTLQKQFPKAFGGAHIPFIAGMIGEFADMPELVAPSGAWLLYSGIKGTPEAIRAIRESGKMISSIWKSKLPRHLKFKGIAGALGAGATAAWTLANVLWGAEWLVKGLQGIYNKYFKRRREEEQ